MSNEEIHIMDLQDEIEKMFDEGEKIDKRKKKVYQDWKDRINALIVLYNRNRDLKVYNKIK